MTMDSRGMSSRGGGTFKNMLMLVLFISVVVLAYRYSNLRELFQQEVAMKVERGYQLHSIQEEADGLKRQLKDSEDARLQCEATQEKQLKDKNDRIGALEKERDSNGNTVKELEKRRDELQTQVDTLKKEKDAARSDADAQRKEKDAKNAEIEQLKKERDGAKSQLEAAKAAQPAAPAGGGEPAAAEQAAAEEKPAAAKVAAQ